MNKFSLRAVCAAAGLAALGVPMGALAESNIQSGAGTLTATARIDFRVTIPRVLFLQVGTGTLMAANPTINLIDFTVPVANVGDGSVINATLLSGDLGSGAVTARVRANAGAVTLVSSTAGALSNAAGDTLSYTQFSTTAATLSGGPILAAPALANGTGGTVAVPVAANITNIDARWTYAYLNAAVVPPGTYGGVNSNNSRVTYTATML